MDDQWLDAQRRNRASPGGLDRIRMLSNLARTPDASQIRYEIEPTEAKAIARRVGIEYWTKVNELLSERGAPAFPIRGPETIGPSSHCPPDGLSVVGFGGQTLNVPEGMDLTLIRNEVYDALIAAGKAINCRVRFALRGSRGRSVYADNFEIIVPWHIVVNKLAALTEGTIPDTVAGLITEDPDVFTDR